MSFEKPERLLTKEEWNTIADAASVKASEYLATSGKIVQLGQDMKVASFYARKANKIFKVLIDLENEYYEAHPDEDPDRKGEE